MKRTIAFALAAAALTTTGLASAATLNVSAGRQYAGNFNVNINSYAMRVNTGSVFAGVSSRSGYDTITPYFRTATHAFVGVSTPTLRRGKLTAKAHAELGLTQFSMPAEGGHAPGNVASTYGNLGGGLNVGYVFPSNWQSRFTVSQAAWSERIAGLPTIAAPTVVSASMSRFGVTGKAVYGHANVTGTRLSTESVALSYSNSGYTVGTTFTHGLSGLGGNYKAADVGFVAPNPAAPWASYTDGVSVYGSAPIFKRMRVSAGVITTAPLYATHRVTSAQIGLAYTF